ncbi:type II toxin-antitoxin system prevent-host-death family antitoxin [Nostoc sp. CENA67]|uniref:Antitoxin n=1 Tax=Amazonocrinis nigriterrae CENA67 TaxID=2794033 RepID=A0A8J7HYJ8_9NOST|nr:type II toxin-antitoxin system prevent-host-death family antitoxin [Amazonocrinis nigriterrae]MBH8566580.1 type II toxin-antitoxin system prevent-host-death family antitoxin [Amazonocrinis nigriterrae CENA67]
MSNQTNLTDASNNLTELCNQVVADRDVVIITRQEGESVALIAADELDSLLETAHLLRSPKNAIRLLTALERAKTRTLKPQSIYELRQELGVDEEG